jgi:hypothetical protein
MMRSEKLKIATATNEEDEALIRELTKGENTSEFIALGNIIHRAFEFNMTNNTNRIIKLDIGKFENPNTNQTKFVNIGILHVTEAEITAYRYRINNMRAQVIDPAYDF